MPVLDKFNEVLVITEDIRLRTTFLHLKPMEHSVAMVSTVLI